LLPILGDSIDLTLDSKYMYNNTLPDSLW